LRRASNAQRSFGTRPRLAIEPPGLNPVSVNLFVGRLCRKTMSNSSFTTITAKSAPQETQSCWSCGTMRAAQFCESCGKVQPPRPVDYFTFFGLPRKLNVEIGVLENDFYELSRKLHPDLNARSGGQEQEWSLQQSSLLNDAYRTLKDPIKRTQYLLQLEGVELEEQSKSATEEARSSQIKKQIVPPDLLEEVFELNMQFEELRMQKKMGEDDPALIEEIGRQKLELEEKNEVLLEELRSCWKTWDALIDHEQTDRPVPEDDRKRARDTMVELLNRRNYIRNLVRDVTEVLES
jgi:molecular chaperone HscB